MPASGEKPDPAPPRLHSKIPRITALIGEAIGKRSMSDIFGNAERLAERWAEYLVYARAEYLGDAAL